MEIHVFGNGCHGMSLANETWAKDGMKAFYTADQMMEIFQYMIDNGMPLPSPYDQLGTLEKGMDIRQIASAVLQNSPTSGVPDAGIAQWPDLADAWLTKQCGSTE